MAKTKGAARRLELMPVGALKGHARNPKLHAQGDLQRSLARFQYADPIVLDERTGQVVSGHGRLEALLALKAAGEPPPGGVEAKGKEWLVPVVRGWASRDDREATAYLVAANKLTEAGGWDEAALAELLKDMGDVDIPGFAPGELEALLKENPSPEKVEFTAFGEGAADDVKMLRCPKCGEEFAP